MPNTGKVMHRFTLYAQPALWAVLVVYGCTGVVELPKSTRDQAIDDNSEIIESPTPTDGRALQPVTATAQPLRRLTHEQWIKAVHSTLNLPDLPDFGYQNLENDRGDTFIFGQDPSTLQVTYNLFSDYQAKADEIARYITDSPQRTTTLLNGVITRDRVQKLVTDMGYRAYRRPLTTNEINAHMAVFDESVENPVGLYNHTPEQEGLSVVIQAIFQSPYFIYLNVPNTNINDPVRLTAHELATKLSYFLWGEDPDEQLRSLADSGTLVEHQVLDEQAVRLMNDERFDDLMVRFHDAVLGGGQWFPDANLQLAAEQERRLFVTDQVQNGGSWKDMLLATYTYANSELAEIYGVAGSFSSDVFERIDLSNSERRGVLTQVGFLSGVASRPVPRGVWISERMVCNTIGAPADVAPPAEIPPATGRRELWEAFTEQPETDCASCHSNLINPFGFVFESYDDHGRYRTHYGAAYSNVAINTAVDDLLIDGSLHHAENAAELAEVIANNWVGNRCYASQLVELSMGRFAVPSDDGLVDHLAALVAEGRSIRELVRYIIQSKSFRYHQSTEQRDI